MTCWSWRGCTQLTAMFEMPAVPWWSSCGQDVHFVLRMLHVDQKSPVPWVHCRKQRIPEDWVRWLQIWQCIPVVVTPGQAQGLRADVAWRAWWDDLSCVKFSGGWPWTSVTCPEDLVAHHWTGGWFCSQRPFLHLHPSPTSADIPDWGGLLTSSGQRSGTWLTILHCTGQPYNKGQGTQMLTVPRVRKPVLETSFPKFYQEQQWL